MPKETVKVSQITVKEFAEKNGLSKKQMVMANNVLQFLVLKGLVTISGQNKVPGAKGKPANIFECPEKVTIDL